MHTLMPPVIKAEYLYPTKNTLFSLLFSIEQLHLFHLSHWNQLRKYSLKITAILVLLHVISTCSHSLFPPAVQVGKENYERDKETKGEEWRKTGWRTTDDSWPLLDKQPDVQSLMFVSSITPPTTSRIFPPTIICIELALTSPLLLSPFLCYLPHSLFFCSSQALSINCLQLPFPLYFHIIIFSTSPLPLHSIFP